MVAEVANRYGWPPDSATWHEVLALASRDGRFEVRDRLVLADGTALGQPVSEKQIGQRMMTREKLARAAYPHREPSRGL